MRMQATKPPTASRPHEGSGDAHRELHLYPRWRPAVPMRGQEPVGPPDGELTVIAGQPSP